MQISSSLPSPFLHWGRNLNTGENNTHTTHSTIVRRRIFHGLYARAVLHRPSPVAERERRSAGDAQGLKQSVRLLQRHHRSPTIFRVSLFYTRIRRSRRNPLQKNARIKNGQVEVAVSVR